MSETRTVLIISHSFPPRHDPESVRNALVARHLAALNWNVVVLCCQPDALSRRDEQWYHEYTHAGVTVYSTASFRKPWTSNIVNPSSRVAQRLRRTVQALSNQPDSSIRWRKEAELTINKIVQEHYVNVIYASMLPVTNLVIAQKMAEDYAIPFAVDIAAQWEGNPAHTFLTPLQKRTFRALEDSLLKQAAHIFSSSRVLKEHLIRRHDFLTYDDISIIPYGFSPDEHSTVHTPTEPVSDPAVMRLVINYDDQPNISLRYFLKSVAQFLSTHSSEGKILEIILLGSLPTSHHSLINKLGLRNVIHILPDYSHTQALGYMHTATANVMIIRSDSLAGHQMFGEYIATGKPLIVTAPEGYIRSSALESRCAFVADYSDTSGIVAALERVYGLWRNRSLPVPSAQIISSLDYTTTLKEVSRQLGIIMRL